jgi:DNA-binding NarL/FixJ family response regulator
MVIVGHAASASVVLERIAELRPDVLLLSVNLPGAGGLEFVPRIKALAQAPSVIVLALDDLEDYRTAAIQAGADGFVAKTTFVTQLAPAIAAIDAKALDRMKIHD